MLRRLPSFGGACAMPDQKGGKYRGFSLLNEAFCTKNSQLVGYVLLCLSLYLMTRS